MGIPGFFGRWLKGNNKIIERYYRNINQWHNNDEILFVDNLCLDFNALIHVFSAEFLGNKKVPNPFHDKVTGKNNDQLIRNINDKNLQNLNRIKLLTNEKIEEELITYICDRTYKLVFDLNPRKNLFISVDGVPPKAKIEKQRQGRYSTAIENAKRERFYFNFNKISPGTEFMQNLDKKIRTYLLDILHSNFKYINIYYSSYMIPGEGEHKIFDFLRENNLFKNSSEKNIIYGADADLIIISLLSNIENITLFRVDDFNDNIIDSIKIDELNEFITETYNITVDDFSLLVSLLGNDFLPRMQFLADPENFSENFNKVLEIYKKTSQEYDKFRLISEKTSSIRYNSLKIFLTALEELEEKSLKVRSQMNYPDDYHRFIFKSEDKEFNYEKISDRIDTFNIYGLSRTNKKIDNFIAEVVSEKLIREKERKLESKNNQIYLEYILTLEWIYQYYKLGSSEINYFWSYQYYLAPTIHNLVKFLTDDSIKNLKTNKMHIDEYLPRFNILHQLVSILPISDWYLLPKNLYKNLKTNPTVIHLFPDPKGVVVINQDYIDDAKYNPLRFLYLPFINQSLIFNIVESATLDIKEAKLFFDDNENIFDKINKLTNENPPLIKDSDKKYVKREFYKREEPKKEESKREEPKKEEPKKEVRTRIIKNIDRETGEEIEIEVPIKESSRKFEKKEESGIKFGNWKK